ncbi:MAG: serine/threonine protein kinase, partial [Myxococcales bacterium]
MPAPPLPDVPEGTVLGGKFVVHRELGKGGMGVVYE